MEGVCQVQRHGLFGKCLQQIKRGMRWQIQAGVCSKQILRSRRFHQFKTSKSTKHIVEASGLFHGLSERLSQEDHREFEASETLFCFVFKLQITRSLYSVFKKGF